MIPVDGELGRRKGNLYMQQYKKHRSSQENITARTHALTHIHSTVQVAYVHVFKVITFLGLSFISHCTLRA